MIPKTFPCPPLVYSFGTFFLASVRSGAQTRREAFNTWQAVNGPIVNIGPDGAVDIPEPEASRARWPPIAPAGGSLLRPSCSGWKVNIHHP